MKQATNLCGNNFLQKQNRKDVGKEMESIT